MKTLSIKPINFIIIFVVLALNLVLYLTIKGPNKKVISPLIGRNVPEFSLALLDSPEKVITPASLIGKPYLINFFSSWCVTCNYEHETLMSLRNLRHIPIYGIAVKDDKEKLQQWLKNEKNPYEAVLLDPMGQTSIEFGISGLPETFLIDKEGKIAHKHSGPINSIVYERDFIPLFNKE